MYRALTIDRRASENRWTSCHPGAKTALAMSLLATASWHPSIVGSAASGFCSLVLLRHVGVTWTELADTTSLPVVLLLLGTLPVAVHVTPAAPWVALSAHGPQDAVTLAVRAVGGLAATLLLAFSTPMGDLAWLLGRLRVPRPLIEMLLAMHRFLFALWQTAETLRAAQQARLGFIGWTGRVRSAGQVAGALFGRTLDRAIRLERGLAARGGLPAAGGVYTPAPADLRAALLLVPLLILVTVTIGGRWP